MSYSQYGEDLVIHKAFRNIARPGRLLDIGAWYPKTFSNSRLLIEKGWKAVLCEFSPKPVHELVEEYGNSNDVIIIQAAVSITDNGSPNVFDVTDDGLSTCTAEIRKKWNETGGFFGRLWVPQLSLERLLFQFGGDFQFVNIDTEGTSVDLAVHYLGALEQRPNVMCVEHDNRIVEIMQVAQNAGYKIIHTNGTNVILSNY